MGANPSLPGIMATWSDEEGVRELMDDPRATPMARALAEDSVAARDPLSAGPRLRQGLVPRPDPGHAELRRLRIGIALRRLQTWEAREVLAAVVEDPDLGVRVGLAAELARFGDGMVLDLLPRLARSTQPEPVLRAVLAGVREHMGRLPAERVVAVLKPLESASPAMARAVPAMWLELSRVHPGVAETARAACEAGSRDAGRPAEARAASEEALLGFEDVTVASTSESAGVWRAFRAWFGVQNSR